MLVFSRNLKCSLTVCTPAAVQNSRQIASNWLWIGFHKEEENAERCSKQSPNTYSNSNFGLLFDHRFNWKGHIDQFKSRFQRALCLLKCNAANKILKRSSVDYGSVEYVLVASSNLKGLDAVQNSCLRISWSPNRYSHRASWGRIPPDATGKRSFLLP